MKIFQILFLALAFGSFSQVNAQTADEIIDAYLENSGGADNWRNLKGMEMTGDMDMMGMNIPIKIISMKDSRQMTEISVQGQVIKQGVFDGEVMWGINFMNGQPEEMEAEMVDNFKKNEANDFPTPLLDYKDKGYTVELLGKETMEGTECFKIKLTKKPIMINGVEEEVVTIYYFDAEDMVPIAEEMIGGSMNQGPPGEDGKNMMTTYSDYQEVEGLYFPFTYTMPQGVMKLKTLSVNPEVTDDLFAMPAVEAAPATGNK